jgi:ribose transport system ATP-binding protein
MSGQNKDSSQKITEFKANKSAVSVAEPGRPALEAKDVKVTADSPTVDLRAEAGEILGLAGLEGQGQAEFIRALGCIDPLFAGEIRVSGKDDVLAPDSIRSAAQAGIAYVSGDRKKEGVFPFLSIFENFAAPLFRRESGKVLIGRRPLLSAFGAHAKHLGLRFGQSDDLITTLSGGNQQKVLLSQAIAKDPMVILLNDPSRGVDIKTKNVLRDLLREMRDSKKVVIFLSSEIEELVEVCDRVAVFRNGGIYSWLEGAEISTDAVLSAMFGQTNEK